MKAASKSKLTVRRVPRATILQAAAPISQQQPEPRPLLGKLAVESGFMTAVQLDEAVHVLSI